MCDVFAAHPIIYLIGLLGHSGQKICVLFLQHTQFIGALGHSGQADSGARAPADCLLKPLGLPVHIPHPALAAAGRLD